MKTINTALDEVSDHLQVILYLTEDPEVKERVGAINALMVPITKTLPPAFKTLEVKE